MKLFKYYVDVVTLIFQDGSFKPLFVCWGKYRYRIEKVLTVRETYSKAGGCGICYTCRMNNGQQRNLFWERNRWFVESEIYIPGAQEARTEPSDKGMYIENKSRLSKSINKRLFKSRLFCRSSRGSRFLCFLLLLLLK